MDFSEVDWEGVGDATLDTLTMLGFSTLFTVLIGLPLGILLFLVSRNQILSSRPLYGLLSFVINVLRSIPFVILMILLIPLTKLIVSTSTGVEGSIPPLVIAAIPFYARLVEVSLREVDRGVIEAAQAMGASHWQIVRRVLLPESRAGLLAGATITTVTLVSYTAMAGIIGGGGLGDMAIRYGYQRFDTAVMLVTVTILILLVVLLQALGDRLVLKYSRK
ncbi:metal ABC transporter permease [Paenibacillus swuensis]|uniref:Metal ABC transporter permease n=2 Tax=Paenibacillus swuensis TaxID=1178515 RepID=A0A172TPB4_9BACL|nr:methionine ABC transporter permease [Paenibacillus swuensis]ANE48895.1 metal ABC transporter permease [Paenibacillus swuensis]